MSKPTGSVYLIYKQHLLHADKKMIEKNNDLLSLQIKLRTFAQWDTAPILG